MPIAEISGFLPATEPFDGEGVLAWLGSRTIDGVEYRQQNSYGRLLALTGGPAVVTIRVEAAGVALRAQLAEPGDERELIERCEHVFDLGHNPRPLIAALGQDPILGELLQQRPGVRLVGNFDGFEVLIRTIVGQQISVARARAVLSRLTAELGEPASFPLAAELGLTRLFPKPDALASLAPTDLPMPRSRGRALIDAAALVSAGELDLRPGADRAILRERLLSVRGIGPWTVDLVLMRALGEPDILLATDLVLGRELTRRGAEPVHTDDWAPWRSYVSFLLWRAS